MTIAISNPDFRIDNLFADFPTKGTSISQVTAPGNNDGQKGNNDTDPVGDYGQPLLTPADGDTQTYALVVICPPGASNQWNIGQNTDTNGDNDDGWDLQINSLGRVTAQWASTVGVNNLVIGRPTTTINDGLPHTIICSQAGPEASGFKMAIDGVKQTSWDAAPSKNGAGYLGITSTRNLITGKQSGNTWFNQSELYLLRMWKADEVDDGQLMDLHNFLMDEYNNGAGPIPPQPVTEFTGNEAITTKSSRTLDKSTLPFAGNEIKLLGGDTNCPVIDIRGFRSAGFNFPAFGDITGFDIYVSPTNVPKDDQGSLMAPLQGVSTLAVHASERRAHSVDGVLAGHFYMQLIADSDQESSDKLIPFTLS